MEQQKGNCTRELRLLFWLFFVWSRPEAFGSFPSHWGQIPLMNSPSFMVEIILVACPTSVCRRLLQNPAALRVRNPPLSAGIYAWQVRIHSFLDRLHPLAYAVIFPSGALLCWFTHRKRPPPALTLLHRCCPNVYSRPMSLPSLIACSTAPRHRPRNPGQTEQKLRVVSSSVMSSEQLLPAPPQPQLASDQGHEVRHGAFPLAPLHPEQQGQ